MPKWREIPLHESGFAPDLPPQTQGILSGSTNLVPTTAGVATLPIGVIQVPAEASAIQAIGTFAGFGSIAGWRLLVKATRQHIWAATGLATWIEWDTSQTFTAPAGSLWSFCINANDTYASNGTDALQKSTGGGQFDTLVASVGSVPVGLFNVIVQPGGQGWFLMVLGLASNGAGWAASGINDDTDWAYDVATLGATGFLNQTQGTITGAAPLRGGVVATKATSLYMGTFQGPPFVWSFVLVSAQIGTIAPLSLVQLGDSVAFLGPEDFYLFDGYSPRNIPNQLRRWFFDTVTHSQIPYVQGRFDEHRDCVIWHFAGNGSTSINMWIAWNRRTERWTNGTLDVWMVYPGNVPTPTGEDLPAYIDQTGALYNYPSGPAGTDTVATLSTWDIGIDDDKLLAVTRAKLHWKTRPSGNQSLTSIVKLFPGTPGTAGAAVAAQDSQDYMNLIQAAVWQNLTFSFAGDAAVDSVGIESEFAGDQ